MNVHWQNSQVEEASSLNVGFINPFQMKILILQTQRRIFEELYCRWPFPLCAPNNWVKQHPNRSHSRKQLRDLILHGSFGMAFSSQCELAFSVVVKQFWARDRGTWKRRIGDSRSFDAFYVYTCGLFWNLAADVRDTRIKNQYNKQLYPNCVLHSFYMGSLAINTCLFVWTSRKRYGEKMREKGCRRAKNICACDWLYLCVLMCECTY